MKKIILTVSTVLFLLSPCAVSENTCQSAGTVLYTLHEGKLLLLLADHSIKKKRGWASFGGKCDGDTPKHSAARETWEETRGYYPIETIKPLLRDDFKIETGEFVAYFVKVPFTPIKNIANFPLPKNKKKFKERGPYAWVDFAVITKTLANKKKHEKAGRYQLPDNLLPNNKNSGWLYHKFVGVIQQARRENIFPQFKQ